MAIVFSVSEDEKSMNLYFDQLTRSSHERSCISDDWRRQLTKGRPVSRYPFQTWLYLCKIESVKMLVSKFLNLTRAAPVAKSSLEPVVASLAQHQPQRSASTEGTFDYHPFKLHLLDEGPATSTTISRDGVHMLLKKHFLSHCSTIRFNSLQMAVFPLLSEGPWYSYYPSRVLAR